MQPDNLHLILTYVENKDLFGYVSLVFYVILCKETLAMHSVSNVIKLALKKRDTLGDVLNITDMFNVSRL